MNSDGVSGNGISPLTLPDGHHLVRKQHLADIPIKKQEEQALVDSQLFIKRMAKQYFTLHDMNEIAIHIAIQEIGIAQYLLTCSFDNQVILVIALHIIGSKGIMAEGWICLDDVVYVRECGIAKIVIAVKNDAPFALRPSNRLIPCGISSLIMVEFYKHYMGILLGIILYDRAGCIR